MGGKYQGEMERAFGLLPGELELLRIVGEKLPNPKLLIDVGCNIGTYGCAARMFDPSIRVEGFDPRFGTPAIGDVEGMMKFFSFPWRGPVSTGIEEYAKQVIGGANHRFWAEEEVPVRRLDTLLPLLEIGKDDITLLKADVEGMEMLVLRSLGEYLPKVIQLEWSPRRQDIAGFNRRDLDQWLLERNYRFGEMDHLINVETSVFHFYHVVAAQPEWFEPFKEIEGFVL